MTATSDGSGNRGVIAPSGAKRIQSVDRAVALLRRVAHARTPQLVGDLADAAGLNRSTAWRLLFTLEHHGLVDRDPATQGYVPGYELLRLAATSPLHDYLNSRSKPVLEPLAREVGETVSLLVPTSGGLVPVVQWQAPQVASVNIVGAELGLHATASGKLRLAFADEAELTHLLDADLQRYTDATVSDHPTLLKELARARRAGYAVERDEFELGVSGVSVPVVDRDGDPLAFISIWGLTARLPSSRLKTLAKRLETAARQIGTLLAPEPDGGPTA